MKRAFWIVLAGAVIAIVGGLWWHWRPVEEASGAAEFPLPPYSETEFLNVGPDAEYVGIDACAECHSDRHETFLHTAHSHAFTDLDPSQEPPDGSFEHKPSGRRYRVYRRDGRFLHSETVVDESGQTIAGLDFPIRFLIGSGRFCRSYIVEEDGFLFESPITWYMSRQSWDMSPGYDFPQHYSFERPIKHDCLLCHSGRVEVPEGNVYRPVIREQAIGCESCHGPGSLHVAFHRAGRKLAEGEDDLTIVNPGKLSRERLEAVCATCHLSGPATVYLRGRSGVDIRPGRPLRDYRVTYQFDYDDPQMSVVGHVRQLRLSKCYQRSEDLTCLTCHDPHLGAVSEDRVALQRSNCLSCHDTDSCGLDSHSRQRQAANDNCIQCHMPTGDTDIPHVAFTHHRIGIHTKKEPKPRLVAPDLVPVDDDSWLPEIDRKRNLGLAYFLVAKDATYARYADAYRLRAQRLLEEVQQQGLIEGVTSAALAELYWKEDADRARQFAEKALAVDNLAADSRANCLLVLADWNLRHRQIEQAITLLQQLVRIRRHSEDWRLLGMCYLAQNQPVEALRALNKALAIRPYRHAIHLGLARAYQQLGDYQRAGEHMDKAEWLLQHRQE